MAEQHDLSRSTDKAFTILIELQKTHLGARLTELARRTGLAKSTTHRLLGAMMNFGLVSRSGNVYQATTTCQGSCSGIDSAQRRLLNNLAPFAGDLMVRTGLTAGLAVLHGADVILTHRVYGHQGVWTSGDYTGREPADATAAGRLLLAYDTRTAQYLADTAGRNAEEEAHLTRELLAIRRLQFATNTTDRGVTCIAVPLHRRPDAPNVAFTLTGRADRIEPDVLLGRMRAVARRAANKVMHTPATDLIRSPQPMSYPSAAQPPIGAGMA